MHILNLTLQHLTYMGCNPKYNIYFNENTMVCGSLYSFGQITSTNMPSTVDDVIAQSMQECATADTNDNRQALRSDMV